MKNRIRELREEHGMKQGELAEAIGVRQNTLSTWETGRYEPDNDMLRKIAEFFGVSVDYVIGSKAYRTMPGDQIDMNRMMALMRTVEQMTPEQFDETLELGQGLLNGKQLRTNGIRIPVLGSVPAGIPLEAIEDVIDWEELPAAMAAGGKEYFALEVKGDSMWPDYLPGDVVIVEKTPVFHSGDVAVVYVNGYDATLKEVRLNEQEKSLTIVPHNQSYPPRTFTSKEIQQLPVTVAGVVVELRRKIKK